MPEDPELKDYGQPIQGSQYVRGYCLACYEPIRIRPDLVGHPTFCEDCAGKKNPPMFHRITSRQREGLLKTEVDE